MEQTEFAGWARMGTVSLLVFKTNLYGQSYFVTHLDVNSVLNCNFE